MLIFYNNVSLNKDNLCIASKKTLQFFATKQLMENLDNPERLS